MRDGPRGLVVADQDAQVGGGGATDGEGLIVTTPGWGSFVADGDAEDA